MGALLIASCDKAFSFLYAGLAGFNSSKHYLLFHFIHFTSNTEGGPSAWADVQGALLELEINI